MQPGIKDVVLGESKVEIPTIEFLIYRRLC